MGIFFHFDDDTEYVDRLKPTKMQLLRRKYAQLHDELICRLQGHDKVVADVSLITHQITYVCKRCGKNFVDPPIPNTRLTTAGGDRGSLQKEKAP